MRKIFTLLCVLFFSIYVAQGQATLVGSEYFDSQQHTFQLGGSDATINNRYSVVNNGRSVHLLIPSQIGNTISVTTPVYDCSNANYVVLKFHHICKVSSADTVLIEVRDATLYGAPWIVIPDSIYLGNASNYGKSGFNENSYPTWLPDSAMAMANNNWWKQEIFDITNIVSLAKAEFRFTIKKGTITGSDMSFGWLIDNFEVWGSPNPIKPPTISLISNLSGNISATGPYIIAAKINSNTFAPLLNPYLKYIASHPTFGNTNDSLQMIFDSIQKAWKATIPKHPFGTTFVYTIHAEDSIGNDAEFSDVFESKHLYGNGSGDVIVGDTTSTTTTYYVPYYYSYDYSWSKTLYLGSELSSGKISNIAYKCSTNTNVNDNISIYLKATSDASLTTAYVDPIADGATLVWSGTCTPTRTGGWYDLQLQESFTLLPNQNLIVYVNNNDGSWLGNGLVYWYTSPAPSSNMCIYNNKDDAFPTSNGFELTESYYSTTPIRPITRFTMLSTAVTNNSVALENMLLEDTIISSPTTQIPVVVTIKNTGLDNLTSATINWTVNGIAQTPYNWTGDLLDDYTTIDTIGYYIPSILNKFDTIVAWISMPNGVVDSTTWDDTIKQIVYACGDLQLAWNQIPDSIVYSTGPHKITLKALSLSGQVIPDLHLIYRYTDTNGVVIDSNLSLPMTNIGNNIFSTNIPNIPYYHLVEYSITTTDYLNNTLTLDGKYSIHIKTTGDSKYVYIGDTNTTSSDEYFPYRSNYGYSWGKCLYLASQIQTQIQDNITISHYAWKHKSIASANIQCLKLQVYMLATDETTLTSSYQNPITAGATLVYEDTISVLDTGWFDLTLQNPFTYNSSKNLLVFVNELSGEWRTGVNFYVSGQKLAYAAGSDNSFNDAITGYVMSQSQPVTRFLMEEDFVPLATDGVILEDIISPSDQNLAAGTHPITVIIRNNGLNNLDSCIIHYAIDNDTVTYNYYNSLLPNFIDTVTIGSFTNTSTKHIITVWVSMPNGKQDSITPYKKTFKSRTLYICNNPINPTFTIGNGGDFKNWSDFEEYLKYCTIEGRVTLQFEDGIYNSKTISLNNLKNYIKVSDTLIITSVSGNPQDVTLKFSMVNGFELGNNKNIYIKDLTIDVSDSTYTAILFNDVCDNIEINNCHILLNPKHEKTSSCGIYYSGSYSSTTIMGNIRILNNTINGGYYGIYLSYLYPATDSMKNNRGIVTIKGNNITNICASGIYLENYGRFDFVSNNHIVFRDSVATYSSDGIYFDDARIDSGITNNIIHLKKNNGGTYSTIRGMYFYSVNTTGQGADTNALLANNLIIHSDSANFNGLKIGYNTNLDIFHNTIVGNGFVNSTSLANYSALYNESYSSSKLNIKNNIFAINTYGIAFYNYYSDFSSINIDYNNYYADSGMFAYIGSSPANNLQELQSLTGQDVHSLNIQPIWTDNINWNILNNSLFLVPNVGIDKDILDSIRLRTTTAGAYTINPVSLDVSLSNMIVDNTTLNISLINMGKNAVTSVTLSWEDNGVTQTPINWTGNLADFMSDTILSIANLTSGLHNIKIWINNVNGQGNDNSQLNDTISQMFYICSGPLSGDYTVGTSSSDFESLETALWALNSCGVSGPIVLKLAAGTYAPISIRTTITGSSDINTITITSATGNANDVQFVANNGGAITLMNTNNWKFSSLSIDVSASNSNSFGFYISGEKNTNIEIYNCNINIGINRDSLFGIYVDADSIENLKTIKNNILGGAIGIAFIGQYTYYATSPTGFNIVIDSNNISEFSNVGIYLRYSIKANSISYNNISSRSVVPGKIYGILLETFPSVDSLMNNKISLNNTSSDCYGIYLYACVDTSFIANNEIRKINNNTDSYSTVYGMSFEDETFAKVYNNSIFINTNTTCRGIYLKIYEYDYWYGYNIEGYVELIGNNIVTKSTSTSCYSLYAYNTESVTKPCAIIDYNNYYSSSSIAYISYSSVDSLSALRNQTKQDSNSVNIAPQFIDTSINLALSNYAPFIMQNIGNLSSDINGNNRNATTAIGAYSPIIYSGKSVALNAILTPIDTNAQCLPNNSNISMIITSRGITPIDFSTDNLNLHLSIRGGLIFDTVIVVNLGTLSFLENDTIEVLKNFDISYGGIYNINAWISSTFDSEKHDDSLSINFNLKRISLPFDENFSNGLSSFTITSSSTNAWEICNSSQNGVITPSTGNSMIAFNGIRGTYSTISTLQIDLLKSANPILEFWYWHDTSANASSTDQLLVQAIVNDGIPQNIATLTKNNGINFGWTFYSLPLDSFLHSCVKIAFYASRKSMDPIDGTQYIDRIRIVSKQNLAISEITTSNIDVCNLTGQSLNVVLSSTTSQKIDFSSQPTSLIVNVSGSKTATYNIPLNTGSINGLSKETYTIDNNFDFTTGTYYIEAKISPSIDGNDNDDILLDTIIINPVIKVEPTPTTDGTNFLNCVSKNSSIQQKVVLTNSGNLDMANILLTLNIYNASGTIVQTYNDTIAGSLTVGQSINHTFTSTYTVPNDEMYNVEVIAYLACNSSMNFKQSISECVDNNDVAIIEFIAPINDNNCSRIGESQNISVKIKNSNPNDDVTSINIFAIISADGYSDMQLSQTIDLISAGATIDFTFSRLFTVPEANNYTIKVYIDKIDDTNDNDTLSITKCTNLGINESEVNTIGMSQNMPNPANNMAKVNYTIPSQGKVVFTITSITGQILHTQTIEAKAGINSIEFNTATLAAGIYFYTMDFNGQRLTKKMTIKK